MNDINKLLAAAKVAKPGDDKTMAALLQAVEALSNLVKMMLLEKQLVDLSTKVENLTGSKLEGADKKETSHTADLNMLEAAVPFRKDQQTGERSFLLYRLTPDNEYANSAEGLNIYKTDEETIWQSNSQVVDHEQDASERKHGVAPVVACWIPESAVLDIPISPINTGIWGEMGKNPSASMYRIHVTPGSFEVYSETRQ